MVRDVGLAEDLAQEALLAALEQWPQSGIPEKPGRLADGHGEASRARLFPARTRCSERKHEELGRHFEMLEQTVPDFDAR